MLTTAGGARKSSDCQEKRHPFEGDSSLSRRHREDRHAWLRCDGSDPLACRARRSPCDPRPPHKETDKNFRVTPLRATTTSVSMNGGSGSANFYRDRFHSARASLRFDTDVPTLCCADCTSDEALSTSGTTYCQSSEPKRPTWLSSSPEAASSSSTWD